MELQDTDILEIFNNLGPEELPIGIYLVRPDGKILAASKPARRLLGLPEDGELAENAADFFSDPSKLHELLEETVHQSGNGSFLENRPIRLKTRQGSAFAGLTCKSLIDPSTGEVAAFYGCLVDRTLETTSSRHEQSLVERVEELTADIGRVLHANSSTLNMTRLALDPVIEILTHELGLSRDSAELMPEQESAILEKGAAKLAAAIQQFMQNTAAEMRRKALPDLRWEYLQQLTEDLLIYHDIVSIPESRPSYLRHQAAEIGKIIAEIKPGFLPKEQVRELQRAVLNLQKTAAYVPVSRALVAITQMDHSLQALRDFVTADIREKEKFTYLPVRLVVDRCVASLSDFAHSRGVEIQVKDNCPGLQLPMQEREVLRACSNLLHNAIKYSWSRTTTKPPWVTVEIKMSDAEASISFTNWGVPIAKDEITSGVIFNLGYRGRLSKDRNRLGTGIGLTDAQQTAQHHGGVIKINSLPANPAQRDETDPNFYNQPFITTVTITLARNPSRTGGK